MTQLSISQIYGNIGEEVCRRYLAKNMDAYMRADRYYDFVGSSLLSATISPDFDVSNIREIAAKCRNSGYCEFKPMERPCLKSEFYINNYDPVPYHYKDTDDNKYRYYCSIRNTKVEIADYDESNFTGKDKFARDYFICHFFIENLWHIEGVIDQQHNTSEAEIRQHDRFWRGHPGRIDFFARLGAEFYCIDSKVNRSALSLWQQVRLSWMHRCGYTCQIYNVNFECSDKDGLKTIYFKEGIDAAIAYLNPTLNIVDYNPSKYGEAERLVSDRKHVIAVAKQKFIWFNEAKARPLVEKARPLVQTNRPFLLRCLIWLGSQLRPR